MNRELDSFYKFWMDKFAIKSIDSLASSSVIHECPYLSRDEDLIYLLSINGKNILALSKRNYEFLRFKWEVISLNSFVEKILSYNSEVELCFDDIDMDLPKSAIESSLLKTTDLMNVRFLGVDDQEIMDIFYTECSEDDKDTTEPKLGVDTAVGVFMNDIMVGLGSYYDISDTDIVDLTVVVQPKHRGRGIAEYAIRVLIESTVNSRKTIRYRARRSNLATLRVAEKIGFVPHAEIKVYSIVE